MNRYGKSLNEGAIMQRSKERFIYVTELKKKIPFIITKQLLFSGSPSYFRNYSLIHTCTNQLKYYQEYVLIQVLHLVITFREFCSSDVL